MSIGADLIRGHTDTIILTLPREKDSYGYEINKTIAESSGGRYELKEATLYTAFKRLEDAGLISSYWGDQSTGARRKRPIPRPWPASAMCGSSGRQEQKAPAGGIRAGSSSATWRPRRSLP